MARWHKQKHPFACPACGRDMEMDLWHVYIDDEGCSVPVTCSCGYKGEVQYVYETNFTEVDVAKKFLDK